MRKRGKILIKIIISYSVMIFIPIVCGIAVYYYTYEIVQEQTKLSHSNLLYVIQNSCDSEIRYYKNFLDLTVREETIQNFARNQEYNSPSDFWSDYLVQKVMNDIYSDMRNNSLYHCDYYVWHNQTDKIITTTSSVSVNLYKNILSQNHPEWFESLQQAVQSPGNGRIISLQSDTENYLVLIEPVIGVGVKKGDAVTVIIVNTDVLNRKISSMNWSGGMDWMLMDHQGNILRSPGLFTLSEADISGMLPDTGQNISVNDQNYMIDMKESDYYDLTYVLFTPETMVNEPSKKVQAITILSLFLTLLLGCIATAYFTKMYYSPLKRLAEKFQDNTDREKIGNEYEFIEKNVTYIREKNCAAEYKSRSLARYFALERLLLGKISGDYFDKNDEDICRKFQSGRNLVLVCYETADALSDSDEDSMGIDEKSKRFIIGNVFEEGLAKHFEQETFEYGKKIVTIINIPHEKDTYSEILRLEVENLRDFIVQNFRFSFNTLEGNPHEGIIGINLSWLEACQADEFVDNNGELYIRYEDIRDTSLYNYAYSFDIEERIVNMIRNGDTRKAQEIIDNVILHYFGRTRNVVSEIQTCMLYDIFGTMVKISEEQGINISQMPKLNKISAETDVKTLQTYFHDIIEGICVQIECESSNKHNREISENITEYIQTHYSDPDLNISQIAFHFHMTPAWISSIYKKQSGKSLLNVIRQERIGNAKRLLNEGYSVAEVSQMVGFRESTTFIRAFKSCEGVTPGQLKK